MKDYPTIKYWNKIEFDTNIYAFNKYDGSQIRVEYSPKLSKKTNFTYGFNKFGTRNRLLDPNSIFGPAVDIFYEKYAEGLDRIFLDRNEYRTLRNITVYLEFFGENSFAGFHELSDEKDLVLFDVFMFTKGFVPPKKFIEDFEELGIPEVVYKGIYNMEFINDVRHNKFNLKEGVVAKSVTKVKGKEEVHMVKIKTNDWLTRVKNKLGEKALLLEVNNDKSILNEI